MNDEDHPFDINNYEMLRTLNQKALRREPPFAPPQNSYGFSLSKRTTCISAWLVNSHEFFMELVIDNFFLASNWSTELLNVSTSFVHFLHFLWFLLLDAAMLNVNPHSINLWLLQHLWSAEQRPVPSNGTASEKKTVIMFTYNRWHVTRHVSTYNLSIEINHKM